MPHFIKVSNETGEFHEIECGECGFLSISGASQEEIEIFRTANESEGHLVIEITPEEKDKFAQISHKTVVRDGKEVELPYYENISDHVEKLTERLVHKYKLDLEKSKPRLDDRNKVDDLSKPLEIEMPGGKEIIGFEQKPESIIIERSKNLK